MFIEQIPNKEKLAYLEKRVHQINAEFNQDNAWRSVWCNEKSMAKILKPKGVVEQISDLQDKNIHFAIYENLANQTRYKPQSAFIAVFGETAMKMWELKLGTESSLSDDRDIDRNYLINCIQRTINFIEQQQLQNIFENSLAIDTTYIKEFMLPNLTKLDALTLNTPSAPCLVDNYQKALAGKLSKQKRCLLKELQKKRHCIIEDCQKHQADLGLVQNEK